jgi:hypothetical protein
MTRRTSSPAANVTGAPLVNIPFRPYAPPSFVPARRGANDYKRMPSVAAGVRRPYWGEGL